MIWSENWKELAKWYKEKFDLGEGEELGLSNDTGVSFDLEDGRVFWIGYHDQVKGNSKDPYRIMIGFEVDSVLATHEELKSKGVKFIAEAKLSPTKDYHVATARDPEGNIIQLFSFDVK